MKEMKHNETRRGYTLIGVLGITVLAFLMLVSIAGAAPYAYITSEDDSVYPEDDGVYVIDIATNKVVATVDVGSGSYGVVITPDGTKVYVSHLFNNTVSIIDMATNTVTGTIDVSSPYGLEFIPDGTKLYVANNFDSMVSVIDTATNTVMDTVPVGNWPEGVAVNPAGTKVYVTNHDSNTVSIIDTATNTVSDTVNVGNSPQGIAIAQDGKKVYVANGGSNTVTVIDTAKNTVIAIVPVGNCPQGIAITPDGQKVYVANELDGAVSVIDTATNTFLATVPVGYCPMGVSVTPDGTRVYVANLYSNTVSVIDTATNAVTATVNVGKFPTAFGQFIGPFSRAPFANFSANPTEGKAPLTVVFTDKSTGEPTKWKWNFGDGTTSTKKNPTHNYSKVGSYTVKLTATNDKGSNTATKTDYIKIVTKPVAAFSAKPASGKAPLNVSFTDNSTGSPTAWKWNFGDGTNSTLHNPKHTYSKAGNYTVSLTASNSAGNNTKTRTNYIKVAEKPVANFTSNVTSGYAPLSVQFIDLSKNVTKWKWTFGDGTNSTLQNPTHKYSKAGNYTVVLTASNFAGNNTKTRMDYIKVKPFIKPFAKFTSNITSGRAPLTVAFTDKSTNNPTSWKWTFGDGTNSTVKNSTHKYLVQGNYTVKLIVANKAGNNSTTKINYIKVTPTNTKPGA